METIRFGKSGLRVSRLCMGTMTFAREADEDTSFAMADHFVEQGGYFFDTANIHSNGGAEEVLGKWMRERGNRNGLVVATKVYGEMGTTDEARSGEFGHPPHNNGGLSRQHIVREVEHSLRRLRTDVVDLYQIHRWDFAAPVDETVRALDDLVSQGKVRYIGASNLKAWMFAEFIRVADSLLASRFVSLQQAYSAVNRSAEAEVLEMCRHHGIAFMAYNPLAGGLLTGKYRKNREMPKDARLAELDNYRERYYSDESIDLAERFVQHARERNISAPALALAWVLGEQRVHTPILGARSVEQLSETMRGLDHALTNEERASIPAVLPGRWIGKDPVYDR